MARGKADRQLTVGKKLEILEEVERTGLIAVTAQKYGVKPGQIRDWRKNIDRLKATDPSRLVCASTIQRGHLVFNESYAQYWVGYNKFCSNNTDVDSMAHAMRITYKDVYREFISAVCFPSTIDPTAKYDLECPRCGYIMGQLKEVYEKDLHTIRDQLNEFYGKPFPSKYMYYVTRMDFFKPDPLADSDNEDLHDLEQANLAELEESEAKDIGIEDYISVYVAFCGNGEVMVPLTIFPPTEAWHWERKKPVKLRHGHSLHRTKKNDPNEALSFFQTSWKKFYEEEAKYDDKFVFLLDVSVSEFSTDQFREGLKKLDGYGKSWTTLLTVRNPLQIAHFEDIFKTFVIEEWRKVLGMKKSAQPNDYRKCVAFWFHTAWEMFAGDYARIAFRSCNMYLEEKASWCSQ